MTETSHVHGIKRHTNSNYVYYMCLLDWHGVILPEGDHRRIAYELIPNGEPMDGWLVASSNNETLTQSGLQHEYLYGYYHSRLIFRFALEAPPRDILEVRTLRQSTDKFVKEFLQKKIPHSINELQLLSTELQIFLYPVFELSSDCQLWRSKGTLPYSFPTTCFYAELPDIGRRFWLVRQMPFVGRLLTAEVRIRISGAKIITSPMSDMFFWNLIVKNCEL